MLFSMLLSSFIMCINFNYFTENTTLWIWIAYWVSEFPILARTPILLAYRTLSAPASWTGSVTQASAGKHNTLLVLENQKACLVGQCAWFICNSISFKNLTQYWSKHRICSHGVFQMMYGYEDSWKETCYNFLQQEEGNFLMKRG